MEDERSVALKGRSPIARIENLILALTAKVDYLTAMIEAANREDSIEQPDIELVADESPLGADRQQWLERHRERRHKRAVG